MDGYKLYLRLSGVHTFAYNGELDKLQEVLKHEPEAANARDENGQVPLHYACASNVSESIRILFENGARADSTEPKHGRTPAHTAALTCSLNALRELVSGGADLNAVDLSGSTPLHLCISRNNADVVQCLHELGADMVAFTPEGTTALHMAAQFGATRAIDALLECGVDVNVKNCKTNRTAAHDAALTGNILSLKHLDSCGANLKVFDCWRSTPKRTAELSKVIDKKQRAEVVKFLEQWEAEHADSQPDCAVVAPQTET